MANPLLGTDDLRNLARLKNLKSVGGKRRIATEYSPIEENLPPDLDQTAQPNLPFAMPEGGLAPDGNDVRANQIIQQQSAQDPNVLYKLGTALGEQIKRREQPQEALPIEQVGQEQNALLGSALSQQIEKQQQIPKTLTPEQQVFQQSQVPQSPISPEIMPEQQLFQSAQQPAQRTPEEIGTYVEPGTAAEAYSQPGIKQAVDQMFDISLSPEMEAEISSFEKAMNEYGKDLNQYTNRLSQHEQEIKDRIEKRELSGTDKLLMTLALLAPALVAGTIGGPEALLGGLAGGAKGLTDVLGRKEEQGLKDEQKLSELAMEKAQIGKERAGSQGSVQELRKKIEASHPNKELHDLLMKDGKVIKGQLVLDTGNPLLPIKASALKSGKDVEQKKYKDLPELSDRVAAMQLGVETVDAMQELLDYADAIKKGQPDFPFYELAARGFKAGLPFGRDTLIDKEGNEVTIANMYDTLHAQGSQAFRNTAKGVGGSFKSTEEHFEKKVKNPFVGPAFLLGRSDIGTNRKQLDTLRKEFINTVEYAADQKGFYTEPLKEYLSKGAVTPERQENLRKKNRAKQAAKQAKEGK